MSVNTAFNIFVRTVVRTRSIPFRIEDNSSTREELLAQGRILFEQLREQAKNNGLEGMSLEEINEEIKHCRKSKE